MRFYLTITMLIIALQSRGQNTVTGTFSPASNYTWLIAYKLEPGGQNYIADTRITNGSFTLNLPENSPSGSYRLVYGVPQDEFYFDIIYNGREDIALEFNSDNGVSFISSLENKIFHNYFEDILEQEQKIISFYCSGSANTKEFENLISELKQTQKTYEKSSEGLIAHQFIVANKPYFPSGFESPRNYIYHKKETYFQELDFGNPVLKASGFLTDKVLNYVFTAVPTGPATQSGSEELFYENIRRVHDYLKDTAQDYKIQVFNELWKRAVALGYDQTSDFIYSTYLKPLAVASGNQEMIQEIEIGDRLKIGALAPDMRWQSGDTFKKLSSLEGAQNYVLEFWSSTCSHCLNELPKLHKGLSDNEKIKVIAVGLEDDEVSWKREASKLPAFEHVISLGKWESEYSNTYSIQKTPTYFILGSDKKIIAKPDDYEGVLEFLMRK